MGTNYYVDVDDDRCDHCGRGGERLHIGKSSDGWPVTVHVMPERSLTDWPTWAAFLDARMIEDEYGEKIALPALDEWVRAKRQHKDAPHAVAARRYYPSLFQLSADGDHLSPGEFS